MTNTNLYTTCDIGLAVCLIINNFELMDVHWINRGREEEGYAKGKAVFNFKQSALIPDKVDQFTFGKMLVEPRLFNSIRRSLYDRINEAKRLYLEENPE